MFGRNRGTIISNTEIRKKGGLRKRVSLLTLSLSSYLPDRKETEITKTGRKRRKVGESEGESKIKIQKALQRDDIWNCGSRPNHRTLKICIWGKYLEDEIAKVTKIKPRRIRRIWNLKRYIKIYML